jgi:hypothetical protein
MHRDNFNDLETSCAGGRPPEGNKNYVTNCLWEMSRKTNLVSVVEKGRMLLQ